MIAGAAASTDDCVYEEEFAGVCVCIWMMLWGSWIGRRWQSSTVLLVGTSEAVRHNSTKIPENHLGSYKRPQYLHTSHQIITLPILFPSVLCILNLHGLVLFHVRADLRIVALPCLLTRIGYNMIILADYGGIYDYFSSVMSCHVTLYAVFVRRYQ